MQSTFLTNYSEITFLNKLKESFKKCNSFLLSVSFIKKAGLLLIENEIEEALNRGVQGKIITSTYQNFTDIPSLEKFLSWQDKYTRFSCHLDLKCFDDNGFHSKGYIFEYDDYYELIIGSTNITRFALLKNVEWNVSLSTKDKSNTITDIYNEYDYLWRKTFPLTNDLIGQYKLLLDFSIEKWDMDYILPDTMIIRPNIMQKKALREIRRYRDTGVKKALVIAATGSGKTYLSAFDARSFDAKRVLYVCHRDAILIASQETFRKVFGSSRTYGYFTGTTQETDCEFIFATNTMLSGHLNEFSHDEFDYIIIDECHHACATTYNNIINYFNPEFLLGLTATPDRMDDNDIYSLFEQNVPFELRLRDAIINKLVVPFHYYAIRDELVDYSILDRSRIAREIAKTINVDFISSQIEKYRPDGKKLKAVAFCTNILHCNLMARELEQKGYRALALTGGSNSGERIKAFNDLQDDDNQLEIICTVDILNEGIDIPAINVLLFLRPTESQTIFLQQLGRGLRKYPDKKFTTVLDFIGNNYARSIQIALALGTLGKTTYTEKTYLRDLVTTNFKSLNIPDVEILFDDLAKTEIINYINNQNFNRKNFLQKDYENFKKYLNKDTYPSHMDYIDSEIAPNLIRFMKCKIDNKMNRSYYTFLKKIGEESIPLFNENQILFIDRVSELLPLIRPEEYLIIREMLKKKLDLDSLVGYNERVNKTTLEHAYYISQRKNIIEDDLLNVDLISDSDKLESFLEDLLSYGLTKCSIDFGEFTGKFKLLGNYYKEQIQMERLKTSLMNERGTEFDVGTKETFCYVNLKKDKKTEDRLTYKDKFLSSNVFQWESETNTTLTNKTGVKIINTETVYLFVRKMTEENGITLPFTYIGTGKFENWRESFTGEGENRRPTLLLDIVLDNEVDSEYYLDFEIPDDGGKR